MYQVLLDGEALHDPVLGVFLIAPVLTLTDNKTGAFTFQITADHPGYHRLRKLSSVIQVLKDSEVLFRGRLIDEETDFHGTKTVNCEGELAFLLDSMQKAAAYPNSTPQSFLQALLTGHNNAVEAEKQIYLGNVTVTQSGESPLRCTNYGQSTLEEINEQLLMPFGGHLRLRYNGEKRYLDYLESYNRLCPQVIAFGENLLDYSEQVTAGDIATCVIPLGKKQEKQAGDPEELDRYLTIASVNGGKDTLENAQAVTAFGKIIRTIKYDDVTDPAELKRLGEQYLSEAQYETLTLSLKAVDLSLMDVEIAPIRMGDTIRVVSRPHGVDRVFPVLQRTYHLGAPAEDTIVLGNTMPKDFNDTVVGGDQNSSNQVKEQAKQSASWAESAKQFSVLAASSVGCYETVEPQPDGTVVHYWHDKPKLADSIFLRKLNAEGYFISNDGGQVWYGLDSNANALLENLIAKSVVADKIVGGTLKGLEFLCGNKEEFHVLTDGTMTAKKANIAGEFKVEPVNSPCKLVVRDSKEALPYIKRLLPEEGYDISELETEDLDGAAIDYLYNGEMAASLCFANQKGYPKAGMLFIGASGMVVRFIGFGILGRATYALKQNDAGNVAVTVNGVEKMAYTHDGTEITGQTKTDDVALNSLESKKEHIVAADSVSHLLKQAKVYRYDLKSDQNGKMHSKKATPGKYGFVIGREVPEALLTEDSAHISLYNTVAVLWKAVQELEERVEALEQFHDEE